MAAQRHPAIRQLHIQRHPRATSVVLALARQHNQARAQKQSLRRVVCHEHYRRPRLAPHRTQQPLQTRPRRRIQRTERLIHQQHPILHHQRLRNRYPLLHASRELVRILPRIRRLQSHVRKLPERLHTHRTPSRPIMAAAFPRCGTATSGAPSSSCRAPSDPETASTSARHISGPRVHPLHLRPSHRNLSRSRPLLSQHHAQQRALAAACLSQQHHKLALFDLERNILQHTPPRRTLQRIRHRHILNRDRLRCLSVRLLLRSNRSPRRLPTNQVQAPPPSPEYSCPETMDEASC